MILKRDNSQLKCDQVNPGVKPSTMTPSFVQFSLDFVRKFEVSFEIILGDILCLHFQISYQYVENKMLGHFFI